ncbi:MAG: S9 family peptidase [Citrobacter freundii]|nr:MAG: S9 family peptidase [Citrobacter freundii]
MLKPLVLSFFLVPALMSVAQEKADSSKKPRPMGWKDISSWRSVSPFSVSLSPDGNWVAYPLMAREGDGELIVRKVNADTIYKKYAIGGTSAGFSFSEDGKWLAFKESTKFKEAKAAAKTPGKQLFDKLILVELATGKQTEFERAGVYSFNGKLSSHLAVAIVKERTMGGKPDDPRGADLLIVELASGKTQNIGNVGEFDFNKAGNLLAYTIDATNKTGNGLYLLNVGNKQTAVLDNDKAVYKSLSWNEDGDAFALLKTIKDEKYKSDKGVVIGVKNVIAVPAVTIYDPAKDSLAFPKGMTISSNRRPYWSDDLGRLFFGIAALQPAKKENADTAKKAPVTASAQTEAEKIDKLKTDTSIKSLADLKKALAKLETKPDAKPAAAPADDITKPDMIIWNWQDKRLQSRQQVMEMQDKNFTYLASYTLAGSSFKQLNDSSIRTLSVFPKQLYAVATDIRDYELDQNLDGQSYSDLYIVDLKTGAKTLFEQKFYQASFSAYPQASPDGTKFVYGKDGHFYIYDILAKTNINITEKVPTSFINTEDDHNVTKPLMGVVGWSSDNKYVLVRDLWDIWQIPVNGKEAATNLTVSGRNDKTRFQGRFILDRDEKGIDLKKPMYVRMYGEWTKKAGVGRIEPGSKGLKAGVKTLVWDDISLNTMVKAKNADVYMFSKETFTQPTEFYTANAMMENAKQVTQNAPDRDRYTWSAGVQLVNYVSDKGDSLQGALFLPAGYEKGKKYPTVVYYYEKMSQSLNSYSNPDFPGGGWQPAMYTSNGYAVFMPDIVYKMDDPGMSAVWCVLPAVKAAIATGVIDEKNIGIQGHSWGGYQTAFLATQTSMFKAAAPGAALTNMVSMYDLIYWNSGGGNMSIFEASQGRFKGAPWENWDSYLRNSPIYYVKNVTTPILLLHNDKDGAVDFTQGIEFYNALRRLKKPVVMITYKGENHGIAKLENRKDYAVRMMEFFDYHLKGKPAPDWWKSGVEKSALEEHLEKRAFDGQE